MSRMPGRKPRTGICLDIFEVMVPVSVVATITILINTRGFGFVDNEPEDDVIQLFVHVLLPSLDSFQSSFQVLEHSDVLH